jgi:hypothetical protein
MDGESLNKKPPPDPKSQRHDYRQALGGIMAITEQTADIVAPTGKSFTLSISSGKISSASLEQGAHSTPLTVGQDRMSVVVTPIPSGGSFVSMAMEWAPGDTDATVSATAPAKAVVPPPIIDLGDNPGTVTVFGKD